MGWADHLNRARLGWALQRNQLIGNAKVRSMASWFPPARWTARRYARNLFDLTAGFVYSQITAALIESGLLDKLSVQPLLLSDAAALAGLDKGPAETLLKAAASLGLTERVGDYWTLGPKGAALAASPGIPEMILHHRLLYADLADPLAMLRGGGSGRLASLWRYDGSAANADIAAYSALMAASQPMVAEQALAAYDFSGHRRLLDVGGGSGAFLQRVGRRHPHLHLALFDRPGVIEAARARLGSGADYHAGNFLDDPLPIGHDLISLVRVLHDHDDAPASRLLAAIRAALSTNGRVLIVEPLAETPGAEPVGHGYFGLYLAAMRSGRPRTLPEYKGMLMEAGFSRVVRRHSPLPLVASVIVAQV